MTHVSSYAPTVTAPKIGSRWVWEIEEPYARELIEVTEVFWNGEEWWVRTRSLMRDSVNIATFPTMVHALSQQGRFGPSPRLTTGPSRTRRDQPGHTRRPQDAPTRTVLHVA